MKKLFLILLSIAIPSLATGQVVYLDTIGIRDWKGNIESLDTWAFAEEEEEETAPSAPAPVPAKAEPVTLPPVSVLQERLALLPPELMVPYNDVLEEQVIDYIVNHRKQLLRILGKYLATEGQMRQVFQSYGIPGDLTALAVVESALNPRALSIAGAAGLWQIMPDTAVNYGLTCSSSIDERYCPETATETAARILRDLYRKWESWPLAISAYNCGSGNVMKAVEQAVSLDYWDIYQYLPRETRGYMPAFLAALYTIYFHSLHNMLPIPYKKTPTTVVNIPYRITLEEIAKACNVPLKTIQELNLQYLRGIIPAEKKYTVRIPTNKISTFKRNLAISSR